MCAVSDAIVKIQMRLQGGPFDGQRRVDRESPAVLFVERCYFCGGHWWREPVAGAERYARDVEIDGWVIYVWVDERLSRPAAAQSERAISTSGRQVQHSRGATARSSTVPGSWMVGCGSRILGQLGRWSVWSCSSIVSWASRQRIRRSVASGGGRCLRRVT